MDSWLLTLRSDRVFMRYIKPSHWDTAIPSCFLTACALKWVLWGTLIALDVPDKAIDRVLLQTTRTVVGVAVGARVPSQDVANSREPLTTSLPLSAEDLPVRAKAQNLRPALRTPAVSSS